MNDNKISINRVALLLDVSVNTIKRWYKWYETTTDKPDALVLPEYTRDNRGTRLFYAADLELFNTFRELLNTEYRGAMADFNAKWQWGNRGKEIIARKETKKNEQTNV